MREIHVTNGRRPTMSAARDRERDKPCWGKDPVPRGLVENICFFFTSLYHKIFELIPERASLRSAYTVHAYRVDGVKNKKIGLLSNVSLHRTISTRLLYYS